MLTTPRNAPASKFSSSSRAGLTSRRFTRGSTTWGVAGAAGWAQAIHYRRDILGEADWDESIAVAHGGEGSVAANGFWAALNIASIIEYAMVHLKIEDIIVCGHTRCGGIAAIEDGVHENYIADWLCIASGAKAIADRIAGEKKLTRDEKLEVLTAENVKLQIKHLRSLAIIRNMREKGPAPRIHGWLYRVETGKVDVLIDGREGHETDS